MKCQSLIDSMKDFIALMLQYVCYQTALHEFEPRVSYSSLLNETRNEIFVGYYYSTKVWAIDKASDGFVRYNLRPVRWRKVFTLRRFHDGVMRTPTHLDCVLCDPLVSIAQWISNHIFSLLYYSLRMVEYATEYPVCEKPHCKEWYLFPLQFSRGIASLQRGCILYRPRAHDRFCLKTTATTVITRRPSSSSWSTRTTHRMAGWCLV